MSRALFAAALLFAAGAAGLEAQVVDTTRADSLRADTTDYTAAFLKAQQEAKRLIATAPRIGAGALLPAGSRIIIERDSLLWLGAETVSDLLTRVPGVFLLRGGWAGRPELPAYQAHGATSVSYLFDGVPLLPLGQDSVMIDPSMLPLSLVDRVEIERLPGQLRVWLFTRRNDRSAPYSRIGIASGDLQIARYQGYLEKRSSRGPGFAAAFDHFAVPVQQGELGEYSNTQTMLRLDYVKSGKRGAELSAWRSGPDREPVVADNGDTLSLARHGSRYDITGRVFLAPGGQGLGPRIDLIASRSQYRDEIQQDTAQVITDIKDSLGAVTGQDTTLDITDHHRGVTQLAALAAYRLAAASLEGSLFWRSAWTPWELRVRGATAPVRWISLSLDAAYLKHEHSRTSKWLIARAGVTLPAGFTASAAWRKGSEVIAPMLEDEQAQDLDDRSVSLAWHSSFADLEGTFTTNAGFQPLGYAQYPALVQLAATTRADWITVSGRLSPRQWLVLSGWYNRPRTGQPEGQPPDHALVSAAIQSKFLPTFKSGIFGLRIAISAEHWGTGVLGQDSAGTAVTLPGATHYRGWIGLQIGSFWAYYDLYNMQNGTFGYVPGLLMPKYISTFGVRWEFSN
ncbi:MAG TPA: Plug domain-containing protein [Gemmatimonadales bacterium]|nr:Plug domain-containing protein [Gemmatimonadales bacterium]